MYEIVFMPDAERHLKKLDSSIRERIIRALERIRIRPEHFLEKLVGDTGFKLRIGDYRLIIDLDNNRLIILVMEIGHRRNIYK